MRLLFIILSFLVIKAISAFDSDSTLNSTADFMNGSSNVENACFEFKPQSCCGVCGHFFALWCSCDEYCHIYGRCCFDYESVCKDEAEKSIQDHENLMNVTIKCDSTISGYNVPQQIITSCSPTNVSLKTVELCEKEASSSVVVSKVMSKRTELHYKNRPCMLCNGEAEEDIIYWSTMIGSTSRKDRFNSMHSILTLFQNSVRTIPPPSSREIICDPNMISSCVPNASQEEQRMCVEEALSPIRYKMSIYKNTFCLQCNVILEPRSGKFCFPAVRKDLYYGTYKLSFTLSMIFNWKKNRESVVFIKSPLSNIQELSCSLDDNEHLRECAIRKCSGTLLLVNNTCQLVSNHFGCIQYIFNINFTVPSKSAREMTLEVEGISSKLVQLASSYERTHNVTKYYSQNVTLYNVTRVGDQLTGTIILNRMAYYLCYKHFRYLSASQYYKYLDTNLAINLNGSISTKRYSVGCHYWCKTYTSENNEVLIERSFTTKTEMDLDWTSSVTNFKPLSLYIVSLIGISLTRLA